MADGRAKFVRVEYGRFKLLVRDVAIKAEALTVAAAAVALVVAVAVGACWLIR
jgi:hypothetical protein